MCICSPKYKLSNIFYAMPKQTLTEVSGNIEFHSVQHVEIIVSRIHLIIPSDKVP